MKGLSLFANVGIAETYLKDVGVDIVVANELLKDRAKFYSHLFPHCKMIQGDICDKKVKDQIVSESIKGKVDFVIATPPCQGMSIAGEMNPYDERNSLIKYAIDIIEKVQPKFIMFENVVQQLETPIGFNEREVLIPEYIKLRLGQDYLINNEDLIINAMDYGVPQQRRRAIILLVRKDLNFVWRYPKKEGHIATLEEAFKGIPDLWPNIKEKEYQNFFPKNSKEALSYHQWHKPPCHVEASKIIYENELVNKIDIYNKAMICAPILLYHIYYGLYIQSNTLQSLANKLCFSYDYIQRLNNKLVSFLCLQLNKK